MSYSCFIVAMILALLPAISERARGDVFELAGGGRIEGRLLESAADDKTVATIELASGGRMRIARTQITRIVPTSENETEYVSLARSTPDTVEGHMQMVAWCRERKLREKMQQHLERVLELDPNHAEARTALGFRQKDGEWLKRGDVMASRGLVQYEGRFVTPQHVELMERQKAVKATQADWASTLGRLRRWLTGRRQDRAAEALHEVRQIRDPAAAEALVAMLRREADPQLVRLWIEVASRLNHPLVDDALVNLSLTDADPEIRHDCLQVLAKSGRPGLTKPYIRTLRNSDNEMVNRAGAALGEIGDRDAIGPLIDALVTKHKFKVTDSNPNQHAYTFTPDSGAFSFGGGGGPQYVTESVRNPAVLGALVALSGGTSFDYDQEQWRRWLAAQGKAKAVDLRRDQ